MSAKIPLYTVIRNFLWQQPFLLQVLVPQVEKMCIDKGLTDETEIIRFLQNGTLVGLLPVPHPILIRRYQESYKSLVWWPDDDEVFVEEIIEKSTSYTVGTEKMNPSEEANDFEIIEHEISLPEKN